MFIGKERQALVRRYRFQQKQLACCARISNGFSHNVLALSEQSLLA